MQNSSTSTYTLLVLCSQQFYSPTVQQSNSPKVQQFHRFTYSTCSIVLYSSTVQQSNTPAVQQSNSPTVQQSNSSTYSICSIVLYSYTVQQSNSLTVLHILLVLQFSTALQSNSPTVQQSNSSTYSTCSIVFYSSTDQQSNSPAVQQSSSLTVKWPYRTSLHLGDFLTKFLLHGRSLLVVRKRRQPVERFAVMLSGIHSWLRVVQTEYI